MMVAAERQYNPDHDIPGSDDSHDSLGSQVRFVQMEGILRDAAHYFHLHREEDTYLLDVRISQLRAGFGLLTYEQMRRECDAWERERENAGLPVIGAYFGDGKWM